MAIFNFKTTEDATLGGGVYKVGTKKATVSGTTHSTSFTLDNSKFPDVSLGALTADNFFASTTWDRVSTGITAHDAANVQMNYSGGSSVINYDPSSGVATITGRTRFAESTGYGLDGGSTTPNDRKYCTPTHTLYVSRNIPT